MAVPVSQTRSKQAIVTSDEPGRTEIKGFDRAKKELFPARASPNPSPSHSHSPDSSPTRGIVYRIYTIDNQSNRATTARWLMVLREVGIKRCWIQATIISRRKMGQRFSGPRHGLGHGPGLESRKGNTILQQLWELKRLKYQTCLGYLDFNWMIRIVQICFGIYFNEVY